MSMNRRKPILASASRAITELKTSGRADISPVVGLDRTPHWGIYVPGHLDTPIGWFISSRAALERVLEMCRRSGVEPDVTFGRAVDVVGSD